MIVVLFKTDKRDGADGPEYDPEEYAATSRQMYEIVSSLPGFISFKSYSSADGDQVSIARFNSEAALTAWREHPEHQRAQQRGRESFYRSYWVQVCSVIRAYEWAAEPPNDQGAPDRQTSGRLKDRPPR